MRTGLLVAFETLRVALRVLVLIICRHFVVSALGARRRAPAPAPPEPPHPWPVVTVQIPLRNEYHVAEAAIGRACALDYPRDRLQIQVLDDSDDATRQRVAACVAEHARQGIPIELHHRERPTGYKAGALNHGLAAARGELVAIFDADCLPPRDFLTANVPFFADPAVGLVQVRWEYSNRLASPLTRLQSILLDGLFAVDQHVRARAGAPLQFNGTNGIWRRRCIDEAGRWHEGGVAEDVDLSVRAFLAGWRTIHRRDYTVPTEIPAGMAAFREQQKRWALGSAQALRRLSKPVVSSSVPVAGKLALLQHLGRHAIHPLIVLTCVTSPLNTLFGMPYLIDYGSFPNLGLVTVLAACALLYYGVALRLTGQPWRRLLCVPLIIPLATGLSLAYTGAWLRGLLGSRAAFVRTPKSGSRVQRGAEPPPPRYRSPVDATILLELAFAAAYVYFAYLACLRSIWVYAFFYSGVACSFLAVGLGTVADWVAR